jgi:hypothetical protein
MIGAFDTKPNVYVILKDAVVTLDGVSSSSDIAKLFASKFEDLYTSVPYDGDDMISIRNIINDDLWSISYNNDCVILPADVQAAIDRLKPDKNDGGIGLTSYHFKFACHDLSVYIAFCSLLC